MPPPRKAMRILIAPFEISGIAGALKAGFGGLGIEAELAFSQPHAFGYGEAPRHFVPRAWSRLGEACFSGRAKGPLKALCLVAWKAWALVVLAWALLRFDRFIFLYGNTLTNTALEAWLLDRLGKKVVVLYCGSDARPPYVDGWAVHVPGQSAPEQLARLAARRHARIRRMERHGFVCVNSPFTGQFHGRPFVSSFALGVPRIFEEGTRSSDVPGTRVRALHSPSNAKAKGTARIVETVERLKREGVDIELAILEGVTNDRVLAEMARADFVIDQIYSDTPMAAFAGEAAACGLPTVVCGYSASDRLADMIRAPVPPTLYVQPDALVEAIRTMATDAAFRTRLGREAQDFVRRVWSPEAVAERYLRLLVGPPPAEWLIDPGSNLYVHGGGVSEDDGRRAVAATIRAAGPGSLRLEDKPELLNAFLEFASPVERASPR